MNDLVLGIDVGTSAVRAYVVTLNGDVIAKSAQKLNATTGRQLTKEQQPDDWWQKTVLAIRDVISQLNPYSSENIKAISVDATSGTIVMLDSNLSPLTAGIMYNDARAQGMDQRLNDVAAGFIAKHGYRFKDNFALAKIVWLKENHPDFNKSAKIIHQGDYINAKLAGQFTATDWSTALKTACDLHEAKWPGFIEKKLGIPLTKLPNKVVAPGTVIGVVCKLTGEETGLAVNTPIIAGASDGTAALFASGASNPGDFCSCLGSTLIIKGISKEIIHDPSGAVYCHRHPAGYWLPGGAGNVGCIAINEMFAKFADDPAATMKCLDQAVTNDMLPSPVTLYPLINSREERFPFKKKNISAFIEGDFSNLTELYAAYLQGIAFVERWCFDKLKELGAAATCVYTTGGGSKSALWNQIRADVLELPLQIPCETEAVMGSAVIAASHLFGSLEEASKNLIQLKGSVEPGNKSYQDEYQKFKETCVTRWNLQ